jgi:hypothetical protein
VTLGVSQTYPPPELLPQTQPRVLHSGHHREIPSQDHGGFSPIMSTPNPAKVSAVPYENLFCPPSSERLWPPAQRRARDYCRGKLPRVRWAACYGPKLLDTTDFLQRHMDGGPYTPYQEVTLPLQAEEMGSPT